MDLQLNQAETSAFPEVLPKRTQMAVRLTLVVFVFLGIAALITRECFSTFGFPGGIIPAISSTCGLIGIALLIKKNWWLGWSMVAIFLFISAHTPITAREQTYLQLRRLSDRIVSEVGARDSISLGTLS